LYLHRFAVSILASAPNRRIRRMRANFDERSDPTGGEGRRLTFYGGREYGAWNPVGEPALPARCRGLVSKCTI
jgi:hypothetical protein